MVAGPGSIWRAGRSRRAPRGHSSSPCDVSAPLAFPGARRYHADDAGPSRRESTQGLISWGRTQPMHDDLLSLMGKVEFTRRDFVVTSLAAGFALAVQPVSAETITTDTTGIEAGEVKVPVKDGTIPAYRALPQGGGPFPTVLVVQ